MTSLINIAELGIASELNIDSKYDVVKTVASKIESIEQIANTDVDGLVAAINQALDFSGITVVAGDTAHWDATTKVLTVPTIKGDTGSQGPAGINGTNGTNGANGLTPNVQFSVDAKGNLQYEVTYS